MKPRILCIQISNTLINKRDKNDISQNYYEKLYKNREINGYYKNIHFWELPQWVAEIDYNIKVDFHICTNVRDTINFIDNSNYTHICFSVLDVNSEIIKYIVKQVTQNKNNTKQFIIGGYSDLTYFKNSCNTRVFNDIKKFIEHLGLEYKKGFSYRLFGGVKTIPRLTLSSGCYNNCDFCTIGKTVKKTPTHIIEKQINAFKPLKFKLVYLNDKTFGQCGNYKLLLRIYKEIKSYNLQFEGFIIQTTATQFNKLSNDFIKQSHIRFVEIGIETFNDDILKKYHKPHTCNNIIDSCIKITNLDNIKLIPNIIIGIPEETVITYNNTLNFLNCYKHIISHLNIYNLAVYDNTKLADIIKAKDNNDKNENTVIKSFNKDKYDLHNRFYNEIFKFGLSTLEF